MSAHFVYRVPGGLQLIDGGHRKPSLFYWIGEIGAYRHSSFCISAFCSMSKDKWTRGPCFVEARSLPFGWFCRWSRITLFTVAVKKSWSINQTARHAKFDDDPLVAWLSREFVGISICRPPNKIPKLSTRICRQVSFYYILQIKCLYS